MISLWQIVQLVLSAAGPLIHRCDGVCSPSPRGLEILVPIGDTVVLSWNGQRVHRGPADGIQLDGNSIVISPIAAGKTIHRLTNPSGRDPWEFSIEGLPRHHLDIELHAVGTDPNTVPWKLPVLEKEINRFYGPAGLSVRLTQGVTVYLERREWDLNRNFKLDLWRNGTIAQPSPEQVALVKNLLRRGLEFPKFAILQEKSRVGWTPKQDVRAGDTVLRLADDEPLVWRDKAGAPMRYVLESPLRDHSDTFFVKAYLPGGALRISTSSGGWRWDHTTTDLVVRPDMESPAFGFVDHSQELAPPVLLIPPSDTSSIKQARILSHELGHALGLEDTTAGDNLMSALLRPEVANPVLSTEQVRDLSRRMNETKVPLENRSPR